MLTKKKSCFLLLFLCFQMNLPAQDKLNVKFGKVKPEDFELKSPLIDSSANAVVVANVGSTEFIANTSELTFSLIFKEKKRIKIINKNGFDAATVTIPLYVSNNNKSEKLDYFDAYTYNIEDGKVVSTKVPRSSVFVEQHSKNWVYNKFTFPALKEGSIIEYSYEVKSDFFFNLQPWTFQGKYPVLWSEYRADIPQFYKYVILSQGYQPFFVNKVDRVQKSFSFIDRAGADDRFMSGDAQTPHANIFKVDGEIENHTWVMKDVPALKEEAYTTTIKNALVKIEFQLNTVVFPNSAPHNYMDTWETVASQLMQDEEFGGPIDRPNNWLDKDVNDIVSGASNQLEKTQKIFGYVRDNFVCSKNSAIYVTTGLKDVFKNKNGSVADINMLLIAMLKTENISATPVILSTRDHGYTHEFYPLIDRYNYVIAKVVLDNKVFYLDATEPWLEFGTLPSEIYNGQAREITKEMASPIYFVADSLRESGNTQVFIANVANGGVEGDFTHVYGVYKSLEVREKARKTLADDYKQALQQEYPEEIAVDRIQIDSLELLGKPVALKYDLKFKAFADADVVYFNPMLSEAIKKNPFVAAERFYPVEMPYTSNDVYNLTMEIPKGYKVDELPKPVRVNLNGNDGMFEYLITSDASYIQMRCTLLLSRATYLNEDYQFLRDFYNFVIKKEAEQIVFKKIN